MSSRSKSLFSSSYRLALFGEESATCRAKNPRFKTKCHDCITFTKVKVLYADVTLCERKT
jgi:hypothetical protein